MLIGNFFGELRDYESLDHGLDKESFAELKKSNFTCSICGFQSKPSRDVMSGYMEVHKIKMQKKVAYKTFCSLCAGGRRLGSTLNGTELGKLAYLPMLSQKNVTDLVRIAKGARLIGTNRLPDSIIKQSRDSLDALFDSSTLVDSHIHPFYKGDKGSTVTLGELLLYAEADVIKHYPKLIEGIRFIPDPDVYHDVIQYYLDANYKSFKYLS